MSHIYNITNTELNIGHNLIIWTSRFIEKDVKFIDGQLHFLKGTYIISFNIHFYDEHNNNPIFILTPSDTYDPFYFISSNPNGDAYKYIIGTILVKFEEEDSSMKTEIHLYSLLNEIRLIGNPSITITKIETK